jgi:hypothetical protein
MLQLFQHKIETIKIKKQRKVFSLDCVKSNRLMLYSELSYNKTWKQRMNSETLVLIVYLYSKQFLLLDVIVTVLWFAKNGC